MGSFQQAIVCGHLGRDAELKFTKAGTPVSNFTVATTETWYDKEKKKHERTEWHRIVLWGKGAESLHDYLTKGKQVLVRGALQTREWEDKEGQKRSTTEIKAENVTLLGGGSGQRRNEDTGETGDANADVGPIIDDDTPF